MSQDNDTPAQGSRRWPSLTTYSQRGTSPIEIWYALGYQNQSAFSTTAIPTGRLSCSPFQVSRTVRLDRIAFEVTTGGGAGSVGRVGIYRSTSPSNIYPSTLVVDGGEKDTTVVAIHSTTIDVTLTPGLYWAAHHFGVANPTCRRNTAIQFAHEMGGLPTLAGIAEQLGINTAYAALPATFHAGAGLVASSARLVIAGRYAS